MGQRLRYFFKLLATGVTLQLVLPLAAIASITTSSNNLDSHVTVQIHDNGDETVEFVPREDDVEDTVEFKKMDEDFDTEFIGDEESDEPESLIDDEEVVDDEEGVAGDVSEPGTYQATFVSQNDNPRLAHGQSYLFAVTVENVGTAAWSENVVHLGTDRPRDRVSRFIREDIVDQNHSGWVSPNRVELARDEDGQELLGDENENGMIDQGEQATFEFWLSVPAGFRDGVYQEHFNVVADSIAWLNDLGIHWEVTVDNAPHASLADQNADPDVMGAGDSYEFVVEFENTGLIPWRTDGAHPVHLGADTPRDRVPGFVREDEDEISGWISPNRIMMDRDSFGDLVGDDDENGQIDQHEVAQFTFWMRVPDSMESGTYEEHFRPVMDNRDHGWMDDDVSWTVVVDNIAPRPTGVSVTPDTNKVTITWEPSAEAESYKVRYGPVGGDVFTILDFPPSQTSATIDVAGGQDYQVGVASVDSDGISPFSTSIVRVESQAEMEARVAAEERAAEIARQQEIAGQQPPVAVTPPAEPPTVTGPADEEEADTRDWRQFWLTLVVILGAAGLATAGYYGYEWWAESRRQNGRTTRSDTNRREPPKPPTSGSSRW